MVDLEAAGDLGIVLAMRFAARLVEQAQDAPRRGHGALVEVGDFGKPRHRPEQALGQEDEQAIGADLHLAGQRQPAADQEGGEKAGQDRHADDRDEGGGDADRRPVRLDITEAFLGQRRRLARLGAKGADGLEALQVGGKPRAKTAGAGAHRVVARLRAALEPEGAGNDRRHRRKRDDGDQRADDEKHRADENDGGKGLDQLVGTAIEKTFELVDVVVQHRDEIAGAVFFVKTRRQVLGVVITEDAQAVLHVLRQAAPEDLIKILEERFAEPDEEGGDAEQGELLHRIGDADLRHEGILAAHHHVERDADQDFRHDVEDLVDDRGCHCPRHTAFFFADER
jgi:hypothetical protein